MTIDRIFHRVIANNWPPNLPRQRLFAVYKTPAKDDLATQIQLAIGCDL